MNQIQKFLVASELLRKLKKTLGQPLDMTPQSRLKNQAASLLDMLSLAL